jgi:serine/threonine protein kinase
MTKLGNNLHNFQMTKLDPVDELPTFLSFVLGAVHVLHKHNKLHRDLKLANFGFKYSIDEKLPPQQILSQLQAGKNSIVIFDLGCAYSPGTLLRFCFVLCIRSPVFSFPSIDVGKTNKTGTYGTTELASLYDLTKCKDINTTVSSSLVVLRSFISLSFTVWFIC